MLRGQPPPEGDYFPDARAPRRALADLERYLGLRVAITYRPRSGKVQDEHAVIRGYIRKVKARPPALVLELFDGNPYEFYLDRIASVTILHG